ncbi:hypothetical protein [Psychroflexus montanilacus]|uniref:hypothetical protein n=1 Tax=Psychroflexus montanilacus TaxID=2873598 RepID=UPI001CCE4CE5|nr:hypothetical protein [Psychroflexus montanilacus]MBZ9652851.1 hypothetical protein [Psychroflexus montanilacus]
MQHYKIIEDKLERFIQKFYTNLLIKGALLFFGFSLLLFIFGAALEYFLWFDSGVRTLLFWTIIAAEALLFFKLILVPASQLFKLSKGIDYNEASSQIGSHFPEVSDKLKNILQLKAQGADDELVLASIEQKSKALKSVPFQLAIDFKQNVKYLRFLVIPVLVLLAIWVSGFGDSFSYSYQRVLNYNTAYEAPAPFQFSILNKNLDAKKGQSFQLNVQTLGEVKPEDVFISVDGEKIRLQESNGIYSYTFKNVSEAKKFRLKANKVTSPTYELNALDIPVMKDMQMNLNYPNYINQSDKSISGTGNVSVPEGTQIEWIISTETTDQVEFLSDVDTLKFAVEDSEFTLKQIQKKTKNYSISTSNSNFNNYDVLSYSIEVVKDEFPKLKLEQKKDSLLTEQSYFFGKLTDDYGLTKLQLVYYTTDNQEDKTIKSLGLSKGNYSEFSYAFPNEDLELKPGTEYQYYFEVFDNDAVNGRKSTKSDVFTYRKKTDLEESSENLKRQNTSVEKLSEELQQRKENSKEIKDLQNKQKKERNLDYTEKQKLDNFIQRQKQQMEMMKNYSERLKEDFKKLDAEEQNQEKENLENRLEKNQEQIEKNQKMLEELEKLKDEISQEELNDKLDAYDRESEKQEKNLEQLLELTKRFYVEKKAEKLAEEIENLAKEQEDLSESDENSSEAQEDINEKFDNIKEELEKLNDKNEGLKAPMELGSDEELSEEIDQDQEEAKDKLESSESEDGDAEEKESSKSDGKQKQKDASEKMKSLSKKMKDSMSSSSMEQASEDAEMLRQILDNLVIFSKEQEGLMDEFKDISNSNPSYARKLRMQSELRENFKHVDDSLYALAMRTPMIQETVNNTISDINFNIEKSLERLAENDTRKGTSSQQYTMMYANELSNMLDDALDQMQEQMNGSGSGKPKPGSGKPGEQLSDIIKSHEELKEQMQKGDGEDGKQPEQGESGEQGEGKEGEQGKQGEDGSNGSDGEKEGGKQEGSRGQQEQMSGEIYQIYKQQQKLRNQLEDRIRELGLEDNANELNKSLDKLEQELLMKGFSSDLLKQMEDVNHQLLKLDKAANQQGQDEEREAETRKKEVNAPSSKWEEKAKEYFNTTEILNRQQLPLQPEYKKLINIYFDGKSN